MSDKLAGGIKAGRTDVSLPVELRLSASSTEQTLATSAGSLIASYWRQGGSRTAISTSDLSAITDAHADGGWKEVDSTNMPGVYRFDVPDAAFATGADWVVITIKYPDCFAQTFMFALESQGASDISARIPAALTGDGNIKADALRWNGLATVALPLIPTTAGRTLDVSATGEAGIDWANVGSPTTTLNLSGTTIATTQKVDVETIKTNPVVNGGTITFPTTATLASTTNITAATGVDITKILGTAITTPATAGTLDVNVKRINNTTAATPGAAGGGLIAGSNESTAFANFTINGNADFGADCAFGTTTFGSLAIGGVAMVAQTGDSFARMGAAGSGLTSLAPASTALSTVVWTGTIAGRIDAAISTRQATFTGTVTTFDGLVSALATAHGAGSWATATGFSTLDAAGVRTAVGLATANLDTQLALLATAANLATANTALVKIQAAIYDTATFVGSTATLSNGHTQAITSTGRVTT